MSIRESSGSSGPGKQTAEIPSLPSRRQQVPPQYSATGSSHAHTLSLDTDCAICAIKQPTVIPRRSLNLAVVEG